MGLSMILSSGSQLLENSAGLFRFSESAFLGCDSITFFQHYFCWDVYKANMVPIFCMQAESCSCHILSRGTTLMTTVSVIDRHFARSSPEVVCVLVSCELLNC